VSIVASLVENLLLEHNRKLGIYTTSIGPNVEVKAVLADVGSIRARASIILCSVASNVSFRGSRGCGGFQRFWAGSVGSEGNTKVGCDVGLGAVEVCL
jgi:hypothetical protein